MYRRFCVPNFEVPVCQHELFSRYIVHWENKEKTCFLIPLIQLIIQRLAHCPYLLLDALANP